jgi:tetratricopeptide (TPR) repeat protein
MLAVAQLDHPNIVPIFEVGERDGQHYFSMKLVRGESLDKRLNDYVADPRRAARVVALTAAAIHHAHQRGILHRDLKPANILVDAEGQPHVSDFGLAKRVEGDLTLTQSGVIVGTPAYMAPEQTTASKGAVTTATDVHGLGAVLYALLTGRPPFASDSVSETFEKVRDIRPDPPGKFNSKVGRDLQTICLKCLEKDPGRRYASADALAEDLERWLAGKPIAARPAGNAARLGMWCRRNPLLAGAVGLAASALIATALLSLVYARQQARAAARIEKERDIAEAQRRLAREAVDAMYTRVAEKWLPYEPRMEPVRKDFLNEALGFYERSMNENDPNPAVREETAKATGRVGTINSLLGNPGEAERAHRRAISISERLTAEFPTVSRYQYERLGAYLNLVKVLRTVNVTVEAEQITRRAIELCRQHLAVTPHDPEFQHMLASFQLSLGDLLQAMDRPKDAVRVYQQTITLEGQLVAAFPESVDFRHELAMVHGNQGAVFVDNRRYADAEKPLRAAIKLYEGLANEVPAEPDYRDNLARNLHGLAIALHNTERTKDAQPLLLRAIELQQKLSDNFPSTPRYRQNVARDYYTLAGMCDDLKQPARAEKVYRQALAVYEKLVVDYPALPMHRNQLADCQTNLGFSLAMRGRFGEAERPFKAALDQYEALVQQFPNLPGNLGDRATARHNLANLQFELDKPEDARAMIEKAIADRKALLAARPDHTYWTRTLALDYHLQAQVLIFLDDQAGANAAFAEIHRVLADQAQASLHEASALAHCLPKLAKAIRIPAARRKKLSQGYADRAIVALRDAVKQGLNDVKTLRETSDFDPIRDRNDFKVVVRELEAKQGSGQQE